MAVLGTGAGHGGCSILHALGAGYGASIGLALTCRVRVRDNEPSKPPEDPNGVLTAVLQVWEDSGFDRPADEVFWQVRSEIPAGQGLKSSAALSVAAIRALCEATETELTSAQIVDLSAMAQVAAGVSFTGSIDDSWAAVEPGWKVVDPNVPAEQGVLLAGEFQQPEDWIVLIVPRGERDLVPDPERFTMAQAQFQRAITAVEQDQLLVAITENGRAVATSLGDPPGRRMANDLMVWGARSAAISGSGPAVVAFVPKSNESSLSRIEQLLDARGFKLITTSIWVQEE